MDYQLCKNNYEINEILSGKVDRHSSLGVFQINFGEIIHEESPYKESLMTKEADDQVPIHDFDQQLINQLKSDIQAQLDTLNQLPPEESMAPAM